MSVAASGEEWIVDAFGCDAQRLRDEGVVRRLLAEVMRDLKLQSLSEGFWHTFAGEAGVTGLIPLCESHLTVHTWPERRVAAINLFCCHGGCEWAWEDRLREALGAQRVSVKRLVRGQAQETGQAR